MKKPAEFKVGDSVRVVSTSRGNLTGTVVQILPSGSKDPYNLSFDEDMYMVEFDDKELIPNRIAYIGDALELIDLPFSKQSEGKYYSKTVCECGLKFSRDGGRHSSWCPLVGQN